VQKLVTIKILQNIKIHSPILCCRPRTSGRYLAAVGALVGYYELEVQEFLSAKYKLEYDQILLAYYIFPLSTCRQWIE